MKIYSNSISIVHSNFRMKEHLYLFIQAFFVSGTDTGFRDLQFSLLFPAKNISSTFYNEALWTWDQSRVDFQSPANTTCACQPLALVPAVDPATHPA